MTFGNSDSQKKEITERMAKLVGLPFSSVTSMIREVPADELVRLSSLDDESFKKESVRLINKAQQQQFAAMASTKPAEGGAAPAAPPQPSGAPGLKKLVIPMAPSDGGKQPPPASPKPEPTPASPPASELSAAPSFSSPPSAPTLKPTKPESGGISLKPASTPGLMGAKPAKTLNSSSGPSLSPPSQNPSLGTPEPPAAGAGAEPKPARKLRVATPNVENRPPPAPLGLETDHAPAGAEANPQPTSTDANAEDAKPKATISVDNSLPAGPGGAGPTGIQSVEPKEKKPLRISPQEQEKLNEEEYKHGVAANLNEQTSSHAISSAFTSKEEKSNLLANKKVLIIAGVAALVILGLLSAAGGVIWKMLTPVKPNGQVNKLKPNPNPDGPISEPKGFVGKWAWKSTKDFEQTLENPFIFKGEKDKPFTVEIWLKVEKLDGVRDFVVTTAKKNFRLGFKLQSGRHMAFFDIPETHVRKGYYPTSPMVDAEGWVHLAGVYDVGSKTLSLFVNGRAAGSQKINRSPTLSSKLIVLRGRFTGKESTIVLDELRFCSKAVYTDDFTPKRNLERTSSTVSLFHLEKLEQDEVPDEAQPDILVPNYLKGGEWVAVDTENYTLAVDHTAELEKKMFKVFLRKYGEEKYALFAKAYKNASYKERRAILAKFEKQLKEKQEPGNE